MNLKKLFHSSCARLAAVALLATSLSSCGNKSSELADLIPGDSKVVCKLNLAQVIENTGSTISQDGKIKLSDDLNNAISQPAIRAIVNQGLSYTEGINLEDAYFFTRTASDKGFLVASMTKAETVGENLNKIFGSPKQEKGYDVYSMGHKPVIAVKDNILWIADSLDDIEETIKEANTNPLGSGLKEYLAQNNALGIAANLSNLKDFINLPSQYNDQWICGSVKFQGQTVSGEACMMDINGKREPFGNALGEIDTNFLRYIPENAQIVMAIGNIEAPGLKNLLGSLGTMAGNYGFLLTDLDGTVGAALDCNALLSNLNAFTNMSENQMMEFFMSKCKFILMAHYPQATLANIDKLISSNGMPLKKDDNGIYSFSMNNISVNFGEADGNFAIANYPIKADSHQFNTHFSGRRAAIYAVSKPENNMIKSAKFGSESEIWLESDALKAQCTLTDTNQKFLEAFVSVLVSPEFKDIIKMIIDESMSGSNSQAEFYYEPDYSEYE